MAQYSLQVDARLDKIVGETEVDLDGEQVRTRETNLGDLVTDIMRAAAGADAALINGGSIRIPACTGGRSRPRTFMRRCRSITTWWPSGLTGRQLREALEHGVSGPENGAGRFPQVSGLSFTLPPPRPGG